MFDDEPTITVKGDAFTAVREGAFVDTRARVGR